MKILQTAILSLIILVVAEVNFAQNIYSYSRLTALTVSQHIQRQALRNSINNQIVKNRILRRSRKRGTKGTSKPPRKKLATGVSSFKMQKLILPNKFFKDFKGSKTEKRQGKELIKSNWLRYEKTALKDGFPSNDLAYVFNHFLINNYIVYVNYYDKNKQKRRVKGNGQKESVNEYKKRINLKINLSIEAKIYKQYRNFLSSNANIKRMTNEQKQLLAELLVSMTNFVFKLYDEAYTSDDQGKFEKASKAAKSNLESLFGVSVSKINITQDGVSFVK